MVGWLIFGIFIVLVFVYLGVGVVFSFGLVGLIMWVVVVCLLVMFWD